MTELRTQYREQRRTFTESRTERNEDGTVDTTQVERIVVELIAEQVLVDHFEPTKSVDSPTFPSLENELEILSSPSDDGWIDFVEQFRAEGERALHEKRNSTVPNPSARALLDGPAGPVYVGHRSSSEQNRDSPVFFQNYPGDDNPRLQLYTYLDAQTQKWRSFEVLGVFLQTYNNPAFDGGRLGTSSWLGLPDSGAVPVTPASTEPFVGDAAVREALARGTPVWTQKFENGYLVQTAPDVVRAFDLQGRPVGGPIAVDPFDPYAPRTADLNASQIMNILDAQAPSNSPLRARAQAIAEHMVRESERTGVPAWLMLAQMKFENSLGDLRNATLNPAETIYEIRDGRKVAVGTGSANNLFGFAGTHPLTKRFVELDDGLRFQAYGSYEESITAYANTIAANYAGRPLLVPGEPSPGDANTQSFIERYFPRWQNGEARQKEYLAAIQAAARNWAGISVGPSTVVVP